MESKLNFTAESAFTILTMVSKKKRPLSLDVEVAESAGKKMRLSDGASTSHSIASVANKSSKSSVGVSRSKKSQETRDSIVKTEDDDDVGQTHQSNQSNVGGLTHLLLAFELRFFIL
jgi:hypothetical protein